MRNIKIVSMGKCLPQNSVKFGEQTRYRISGDENQLSLSVNSAKEALNKANMTINDIDLIVSACAVSYQPIPNMSSLIHEQLAQGLNTPCIDINTTCTSFITALDTVSYFIDAGKYKNVLIVAGDTGSLALNQNQKESYELFSDGAVSCIVSQTHENCGVLYALQETFSEGAHDTEIVGGGTRVVPTHYNGQNNKLFQFDMKGLKVFQLSLKKLKDFMKRLKNEICDEINFVVPHQASKILDLAMHNIGFEKGSYINIVKEYGNMVSGSIPFALLYAIENNLIQKGDNVLLIGTAAGLHVSSLLIKY